MNKLVRVQSGGLWQWIYLFSKVEKGKCIILRSQLTI
jgi:hypothetical protein